MDIMWFKNNLKAVGKWGGISFLFGIIITSFIFGRTSLRSLAMIVQANFPLQAYILETTPTNLNQTEFKLDLDVVNSAINSLKSNQGSSPSITKNISQNIDFNRFFSSSRISYGDVTSFFKEAAVTGINLTVLVISITSQILKGLLSVLK